MENNNKGQTIFLSVVGIATLLVAIIGATFAWFSATVTGNDDAKSVIVNAATLGITYTNGDEIKLDKAVPGDSETKTFTVENTSEVATGYKLGWEDVTNDFVTQSDLVYSISSSSDGATSVSETTCPSADGDISGATTTIAAGATHTYSMKVEFKETGSNQNSNQGKKFAGKIEVEAIQTA